MSIGLFDADFFRYHQTIFNLEIMKMATYYKKKKEITIMAPSFAPERYSQFFYRKDFNDGNFPKLLNQYKNLTYGGFAFSNNVYIPMDEEIEQCAPDTSVYDRYEDIFIDGYASTKNFFTSLKKGIHFRLSLDGKTVWNDFERQIPRHANARVFFLHDYNLNSIPSAAEYVQLIIDKYRTSENIKVSLSVKFPIICSDFESFIKWLDFIFSSVNFKIQYNGMLKDEELVEAASKLNPSQSTNIIYNPLPAASSKNDFTEEALLKIFKQVLFLYKNQKHFLLICNDSFLVPEEIKKMFTLFTAYGRSFSPLKEPTALFYFAKKLKKRKLYQHEIIDLPEAIEVFSYTQKNYPELFKLFYENSSTELRGGELQLVR